MTNEEIKSQSLEEKKKKRKKKRKVKKKKGKKDACYHKVRSRYDVWPSAYASGALVKCRKVGAKNWGNKSKKNESKENTMESLKYFGDPMILETFRGASLDDGTPVCEACLFEQLQEASCGCPDLVMEAKYQGRTVTLNKPTRGDVKKFKVYVKDPKTGNIKKVNFGDPNMKIKKSNPKRRKSFRARHNCDNPGPKTKARYWSCKKW